MADSVFKGLIGKRLTKKVKFMDAEVIITKLTTDQVLRVQEMAKAAADEAKAAEDSGVPIEGTPGLDMIRHVIRQSGEGAEDMTDEEFGQMPMDELSKLSTEIMKFSGFSGEAGK